MTGRVHIEVINLARAPERKARMQLETAAAGFEAIFAPAFDLREHDRKDLLKHCLPDGPWGHVHDTNMAASISHLRVFERFLQTDAAYCAVFEDDVFLAQDLGAWLADMSWWPAGADVVKLEQWSTRSLKVLLSTVDVTEHRGRRIARLLSRHVGAAGYILTLDAAERFLAAQPLRLPFDNFLFNFNASPVARSMKMYQVQPAMVAQGNEPEGTAAQTPPRPRPTGMALVRQKLRRGYYEVAYPWRTIFDAISGRAQLEKISFARNSTATEHAG
jgi:glycosyl transferase family 25